MPTHDRTPGSPNGPVLGKAIPRDARMRACVIQWPDGSTEGARFLERDPKSERHAIVERDLWAAYEDDWTIRVPISWLTFQSTATPSPFGRALPGGKDTP